MCALLACVQRMLLTLEELGLLLDFQRDPSMTEEIVFTRGGEEVRLIPGHAACEYTYHVYL